MMIRAGRVRQFLYSLLLLLIAPLMILNVWVRLASQAEADRTPELSR
jgi:hypothetical protein